MIVNLTDAQAYFDTILDADAWNYATTADRTKALTSATRILESLNYKAELDTYTTYPEWLQYAACEVALALLDGRSVNNIQDSMGLSQSTFHNARTVTRSVPEYILAGVPSAVAWRYIKPYLKDGRTVTLNRVS